MSKPLFICGFPSGGTDLIKNILNVHPNIYINGEMPFLYKLPDIGYHKSTKFISKSDLKSFIKILKKYDEWSNIENFNYDFSSHLRQNPISTTFVLEKILNNKNTKIWGNKTPQNTENIKNLDKLVEKPLFLLITRDIRDVSISWNKKWGKNIFLTSSKWKYRINKGLNQLSSIDDNRYLIVNYESLLKDTKYTLLNICDFLDVDYSDKLPNYHLYTKTLIDGKINYGKKIKKDNYDKWMGYYSKNTIKRIEEIAYPTMKKLGYKIRYAKKEKDLIVLLKLYYYLSDFLATLIIGNKKASNNKLSNRLSSVFLEIKKIVRNIIY